MSDRKGRRSERMSTPGTNCTQPSEMNYYIKTSQEVNYHVKSPQEKEATAPTRIIYFSEHEQKEKVLWPAHVSPIT